MLSEQYTPAFADLLFDKTDEFIGIYDLTEERFKRVNRAGVRMLGFVSEAELLADPVRSRSIRTPPLPDEHRGSLIAGLLQTGSHQETALIGRQQGETFWGRMVLTAFSAQGEAYALVRVADEGRLRQTELELAQTARRYEAIFFNATIGIVVCNAQGLIISANQMAERQFGYPPETMLGRMIEDLVPAGVGRYHQKLRESFNNEPAVRAMGHNRELHAKRKDNSIFPVEVSLSYFWLEEKIHIVAFVVDITAKKEVERELLDQKEKIERLNASLERKVLERTHDLMDTLEQLERSKEELGRALDAERKLSELKSRFVSMASHEFRTPLTAVLTSAALIEKYPAGEQQDKRKKHIDRIRTSVTNLNDILEEFLSVGKLEEGKIAAHPKETVQSKLLSETVADMRSMLKPGQTIETQQKGPDQVFLDPSLLRKILVNLISNAIKYSQAGTVVSVRFTSNEGHLRVIVEDQGVGISREDQAHLFERFYRAPTVTNIEGTGLGLHIVGRYVELMGGTISIESELNKGTIVTILLPAL
ncbi:sensor histidine kinase [Salmonirosea aquatica]|uniref:sensor histidine kinase n=1 Tax=Salmonirosea aquatica TaxID=2654236 RepID=UPI0035714829